MKTILIYIFLVISSILVSIAQTRTIGDVIANDTLSYFEKVALIESDTMTIYLNSDSAQQKRYRRRCAFYNNRVEKNSNISDYFDSINAQFITERNKSINTAPLDLDWEHLGPFDGPVMSEKIGQARSIAVHPTDPDIVYIGGASGGIFKTVNALETDEDEVKWTCISDKDFCFGVEKIVIHPTNPDIIYAVTGVDMSGIIEDVDGYSYGIFKSIDAGANWEEVNPTGPTGFNFTDTKYLTDMAIDPDDTNNMYIVGKKHLYITNDAGVTWTLVTNPTTGLDLDPEQYLSYISINTNDPETLYVAGQNAFFYSVDNGDTWTENTGLYNTATGVKIRIDFSNPANSLYAIVRIIDNPIGWKGHVFYFDNTFQWNPIIPSNPQVSGVPNYISQIKVSPQGVVYAGGQYLRKFDGSGWVSQSSYHMDCRDVTFFTSVSGFPAFMATDGGVVRNLSGNNSDWKSINGKSETGRLCLNQFYSFSVAETNPEIMIGGGPDSGTEKRKLDGNWDHVSGGDGGATVIDYSNELNMFSVANTYVLKSTDGFATNGSGAGVGPLSNNELFKYDSPIIQHPTYSDYFIAAVWHPRITGDMTSNSWSHFHHYDIRHGGTTIAMAFSPSNPDKFCFSRFQYDVHDPSTIDAAFYRSTGVFSNQVPPNPPILVSQPPFINLNQPSGSITPISSFIDLEDYPIVDIKFHPTDENKMWIVVSRFKPNHKVFQTINGGYDWVNISDGLPNIPVNCIVYDPKLQGLFLGTDMGLYYRPEDLTNDWQKFDYIDSDDLPETIINDIDLVNSTGDLVIGTYGRGAWRTPIHCGITEADIIINSNTTWNFPQGINANVIVENGATLTITADHKFVDGVKIVVEQGGRLVVDGARLYNMCPDFWEGIVLEGDINTPQGSINNTSQPVIIVSNGAKIEGAEIGIFSDHGGIIVAENCTIKNNMRGIKFSIFQNTTLSGLYHKNNLSYFNKCTFIVDDDYIGQNGYFTQFHEHVYLVSVNGISFKECHFDNQISTNYYETWQDRGIVGVNAGFFVDCNCDIPLAVGQECPDLQKHPSTFKNLLVGIDIGNSEKAVRVTDCEFEDNIVGIFASGQDYPVFTRNKFIIGNTPLLNNYQSFKHAIAIKTQWSTGFQIEENDISLSPTPHPDYYSFGIIVDYSESDNNEVYNNDFNDIEYGVNPLNCNRSADKLSGLQILCNDFSDLTKGDIAIDEAYPFSIQGDIGIREYQGNPDFGLSAGNCFTMNIGVPEGNIRNESGSPVIHLCPCIDNCTDCYYPYEISPVFVSVAQSIITNTCPSHISNGFVFPMDPSVLATTQTNYYELKTAYYNLLFSYYQQLDGGNTPAVLLEIQNTWPQEAWDLRNDLMAIAPFVSTEALEEAALSCVLPDAMLLEICLANPDATRSQEFLDFLAQGTPCPLTQYMIDMIQDNWDAETSRTLLEKGLARYGAERDFYANALIRNSRFQDEYTVTDLIEWHEDRASLLDYYSMADIYIDYQKFDTAEMVLDDIPIDFVLDDDQIIGHNNYLDYFNFIKSMYLSNKTIHDIDSLERIALQSIADEALGFAAAKARNMLNTIDGTCDEYYGYVSGAQPKTTRAYGYDPNKVLDEFYNNVTCIPNPVKDYAIFEWELLKLDGIAQLNITDINGVIVQQHTISEIRGTWTWDTRLIADGIYVYEIVSNKKQLTRGKIVISK